MPLISRCLQKNIFPAYFSSSQSRLVCIRSLRCPLRSRDTTAFFHTRSHSTERKTSLQCSQSQTLASLGHPPESITSIWRSTNTEVGRTTFLNVLPAACPGCGALSQTIDHDEAGYYSTSRKVVKKYLQAQAADAIGSKDGADRPTTTDAVVLDDSLKAGVAVEHHIQTPQARIPDESNHPEIPICDRCHDLVYNNKGQPIAHPTLENIADAIAESPFRHNHVFHVVDAADFPMSLVPNVFKGLNLAKPRSRNRRARLNFTKRPTISFVITRSDLLGSTKAMVDKMMPYFQDVLRSVLGRPGRHMRLGNVHLVSATRGWWTQELKNEIWGRGGGNWMFGKANVGKSNLFPVLFPKGSGERAPDYAGLQQTRHDEETGSLTQADPASDHAVSSALPPLRTEVAFPTMPIVSHLPGTTASPVRLSFGSHRGELIDLPGLDRGGLEEFVHADHKTDLVMRHRPNVEKIIIKPGQSLLIGGGLIRITPQLDHNDSSTTMLAVPFIPLDTHVTATDKAMAIQTQDHGVKIKSILADGAGSSIRSSGMYSLDMDVTKSQAGTLLRAGVPLSKLPFRVYSCDILIEGVGWIELICQVRKRRSIHENDSRSFSPSTVSSPNILSSKTMISEKTEKPFLEFTPFSQEKLASKVEPRLESNNSFPVPRVEIFSPMGKYVGHRKPLGAWMMWQQVQRQRQKGTRRPRPRRSMKGAKKRQKMEK